LGEPSFGLKALPELCFIEIRTDPPKDSTGPPDTAEYPRRILDAGMSGLLRGPCLPGGAVVRPVLTDTVDKVRTIKFCAIIALVCCVKGNIDLAKTP
jgi:hypothetical protein